MTVRRLCEFRKHISAVDNFDHDSYIQLSLHISLQRTELIYQPPRDIHIYLIISAPWTERKKPCVAPMPSQNVLGIYPSDSVSVSESPVLWAV